MSGSAAGSAAAAARRRREQEEEEQMTGYGTNDLEGWEFKIVRSVFGSFRNPETVRKLCEQEARAGWEMLEKFDDSRIRFKRHLDRRRSDAQLGFDPYRTRYGMAEGTIAVIVVSLFAIAIALILLLKP
jgi:hypothetical protein